MNYNCDILTKFNKDWAVVTAGNKDHFNMMTISWGAIGTIWGRDALTIYIRPERFTHEELKQCTYFTVSFFKEEYRSVLTYLGTHSGRDCDKIKETHLHPLYLKDDVITYEEAQETFILKKIYTQTMDKSLMDDKALSFYNGTGYPHDMIIGEIIDYKTK